jgi:phage protein D
MAENAVAEVKISVNGAPLPPTARLGLTKVTVNDDLRMASTFSLSLHSRNWGLQPQIAFIDDGLFAIGATVEIALGYIGGAMDSVIVGEITDIEAEFDVQEPPQVTVTGYDFRQRLGRNSRIESYSNMTDSQIAAQVIARNNLTPIVTATTTTYDHVSQNNESDLDFLHKRAELNGYELTIDGRTVRFGVPLTPKVIPLAFGAGLLGFSASVAGSDLYGEVQVFGVDLSQPSEQEFSVSEKVNRFTGILPTFDKIVPRVQIISDGPRTRTEAQALAKNVISDLASRGVSGSGRCRGNGALRAGRTVAIAGVGQRFASSYRLSSVSHSFSPSEGFATNFRAIGSPQ